MGCGCIKREATDRDKMRELAGRMSEQEQHDYIIYEQNGKYYFDRKECWQKGGSPGKIAEIIFFL